MKFDAVIFDLDGTLTDSAPGIVGSLRHAMDELGLEHPDEETFRRVFLGPPVIQSMSGHFGLEGERLHQAIRLFRDRYHEWGYLENTVFPGIRELLGALAAQGCYLAVATAKPLNATEMILDALDLRRFFNAVAGPREEDDPRITKAELIKRGLPEGRAAVMVGDRDTDILGAKACGIHSLAVTFGYGSREELAAVKPDLIAETTEELFVLLGVEKPAAQGYFISFEGNDGAGKSTQARLLAKRLTQCGYPVLLTREPGGSPIAEQIRQILLSNENAEMSPVTEALLYAAARAQHVEHVIKPALEAGKIVISDRFVDSSIAYQGAGRELGIDLVRQMNTPAIEGLMPQATVFLALSPEAAEQRQHAREKDRLELAGIAFHQRVNAAYQEIIAADPQRFLVIQSTGSKQETAALVYQSVMDRLNRDGIL